MCVCVCVCVCAHVCVALKYIKYKNCNCFVEQCKDNIKYIN